MEQKTLIKKQSDLLLFYGILLFFLGLIVGLCIPIMANPRMGLSSHLEGVMNGMFLVILGLIWDRMILSQRWRKITFWLTIYGTFANWFGILYAAVFDAGKMLTVAAKGQEGSPFSEGLVTFLLISLSICMLVVCIMVMVGLKRNMGQVEVSP